MDVAREDQGSGSDGPRPSHNAPKSGAGRLRPASPRARGERDQPVYDPRLAWTFHRANHDELTGLASRGLFAGALAESLARAAKGHGQTAVLFCDLDGFKLVNDSLAHALDLRTVAEGVEMPEQHDFLVAAGCTLGQGFLYAPPLTADGVPGYAGFRAADAA